MSSTSLEQPSDKEHETPLMSSTATSTGPTELDEKQHGIVSVYEVTTDIEKCLRDLEGILDNNDEKFDQCIRSFESKLKSLEE